MNIQAGRREGSAIRQYEAHSEQWQKAVSTQQKQKPKYLSVKKITVKNSNRVDTRTIRQQSTHKNERKARKFL